MLRKEATNSITSFSQINELPKFKSDENKIVPTEFFSEEVKVKNLNYYFSNSISRASKTMSECRQARQTLKKTGTDSK